MNSEKLYLKQQRNEITEHIVYLKLSSRTTDEKNKRILKQISKDELEHYNFLKDITKSDVRPYKFKIFFYMIISRILGLAFSLRLMERNEGDAKKFYDSLTHYYPHAKKVSQDELQHEKDLIHVLNDEKLVYASSIVLGLNDALVELTGTLAGLTIALRDSSVIALTGIILGFAASLSMAASEFLSTREEKIEGKNPIKSATYTGLAYVTTVIVLVLPYFFILNPYYSLAVMLGLALCVIASYNYYISIAKGIKFSSRFLQMAAISFGVAIVSFIFGYFADKIFM